MIRGALLCDNASAIRTVLRQEKERKDLETAFFVCLWCLASSSDRRPTDQEDATDQEDEEEGRPKTLEEETSPLALSAYSWDVIQE